MLLVVVFAVAIFLNAALLFSVQPLFTKMVLPLLGGSQAVWNTCLLFFQTLLLAGYVYAHVTSRWLNPRNQAVLHLALLASALLLLPIYVPESWAHPPGSVLPIAWLLGLLSVSLGLPFFLLIRRRADDAALVSPTRATHGPRTLISSTRRVISEFCRVAGVSVRDRAADEDLRAIGDMAGVLCGAPRADGSLRDLAAFVSRRVGAGSVTTARVLLEPGEDAAPREPGSRPSFRIGDCAFAGCSCRSCHPACSSALRLT
jgi:hypothetical protein